MKCKQSCQAFSRSDLLVTVGVVFLLGVLISASIRQAWLSRADNVCLNNLKQLKLSVGMWAVGGEELPPWRRDVPYGSLSPANEGVVLPHFLRLTNGIGSPKYLTCPDDTRRPAQTWQVLDDTNISYFIHLDSQEMQPWRVMFGDRRMTSREALTNNVLRLSSNGHYQWSTNIHQNHGNMVRGHGGTIQTTSAELNTELQNRDNIGSRLQMPR